MLFLESKQASFVLYRYIVKEIVMAVPNLRSDFLKGALLNIGN